MSSGAVILGQAYTSQIQIKTAKPKQITSMCNSQAQAQSNLCPMIIMAYTNAERDAISKRSRLGFKNSCYIPLFWFLNKYPCPLGSKKKRV